MHKEPLCGGSFWYNGHIDILVGQTLLTFIVAFGGIGHVAPEMSQPSYLTSSFVSIANAQEPEQPPTPREYLRQKTGDDVGLFNLASAIIKAESGWNANAKNPHSSASGLFQFINGTFSFYCIKQYKLTANLVYKNDPYIQIDCATRMLTDGLASHWNASSGSWKKASK